MTDRLDVGRVSRAHGLRGEIVIAPITNRFERFAVGSQLFDGDLERVITSSRRQGDHFVVRFDEITDRDAADRLRGRILQAPPLLADPDEFFVHDMIGASVVDETGRSLGQVRHVEANPAHDVLVCDSGVLIPVVFIRTMIDGVINVDLPDGLVELYLAE